MRFLIPPYLVLLLFLSLGGLYALHPPGLTAMHAGGPPIGEIALVFGLGVLLLIGARIQFARSGSEIMTFATPRSLVTTGLFRYSRNPMYLGFTLLLVGAALAVNTWCALLAPIVFFAAAQYWYIPAEESAARAAFGPDYEAYLARTRRWF